jgi:hypothetical protein
LALKLTIVARPMIVSVAPAAIVSPRPSGRESPLRHGKKQYFAGRTAPAWRCAGEKSVENL